MRRVRGWRGGELQLRTRSGDWLMFSSILANGLTLTDEMFRSTKRSTSMNPSQPDWPSSTASSTAGSNTRNQKCCTKEEARDPTLSDSYQHMLDSGVISRGHRMSQTSEGSLTFMPGIYHGISPLRMTLYLPGKAKVRCASNCQIFNLASGRRRLPVSLLMLR